jgi:redox-sensitive bicupin YhaK (pirin superfamily)
MRWAWENLETMSGIDTIIIPPLRDLGDGFQVRRALPAAKRRTVGPFVFFDQMGPAHFKPGTGLDVRPHPHIGLATVTYLFEGEIMHRDSLGSVQAIRPAEVNWMVAGSGIVHSERTAAEQRGSGSVLSGIQCWVALPRDQEKIQASFDHYGAAELPYVEGDGITLRLIAGTLNGEESPVKTHSPMFYADVSLEEGARLQIATEHEERAIYLIEGSAAVDGQKIEPGQLTVLRARHAATLTASTEARAMLLGGAALDGPRHVWWNFVSSSSERIEQAKADWREGRFGKVPGDPEFIPLPPEPPTPPTPAYP